MHKALVRQPIPQCCEMQCDADTPSTALAGVMLLLKRAAPVSKISGGAAQQLYG